MGLECHHLYPCLHRVEPIQKFFLFAFFQVLPQALFPEMTLYLVSQEYFWINNLHPTNYNAYIKYDGPTVFESAPNFFYSYIYSEMNKRIFVQGMDYPVVKMDENLWKSHLINANHLVSVKFLSPSKTVIYPKPKTLVLFPFTVISRLHYTK